MALSKFGNEDDLYGLSGGWQVPGMPGMPKKKNKRINEFNPNLPFAGDAPGGRTSVGSGFGTGITYNKPMSKDQKLRRFTDFVKTSGMQEPPAPGKLTYGQGTGGYKPGHQLGYDQGNFQAALKAANQDRSYSDDILNQRSDLTWGQIGDQINAMADMQKDGGGGGAWYDDLWQDAKDLGIKGWGEIGIGAMNAYTGWQEAEMAKKQHALAQETFDFQKAAYNKDREGRVLAYNTNAQNVNAWKEAQGRTDLNKLMV